MHQLQFDSWPCRKKQNAGHAPLPDPTYHLNF